MKASFYTESVLFWLAKGVSGLSQRLPPAVNAAVGAGVGILLYHVSWKRRAVALGNLRAAFGRTYTPREYDWILFNLFRNLGMTFMEVAAIPAMDRPYLDRWIQIPPGSRERLEGALAKGRGVIFITGHFGNWEMIPLVGALHGFPTMVLAREQGWPRLNRLLTQYRESKGCQVVTKGFPVRELIRGLKEKRIVGILADQDGGRHGVLSPFFGRLCSTAVGTVTLALKTGAPILPVFMVRQKGPLHLIALEEELKIPEKGTEEERLKAGVAAYLEVLERYIRRYPSQWLWLHRRWKSCPERRLLILSDGKAGHLAQATALAQKIRLAWEEKCSGDARLRGGANDIGGADDIGRNRPLVSARVVEVVYRHPLARLLLMLLAAVRPRGVWYAERWLRLALDPASYDALMSLHADISISCGGAAAPVNWLWAQGIRCRAIHITRPTLPSWRRFDLTVLPRHDLPRWRNGSRPKRRNLLVIDGALTPHQPLNEERLKQWRGQLKISRRRQIGLLLGGPTKGVKLDRAEVEPVVKGLLSAAERLDAELLVTSSRRTPPGLERWLEGALKRHPRCRLLTLVNRRDPGVLGDTAEAVPCILGLAQALVVSGDSISMVSEAVAGGKPVLGFLPEPEGKKKPTKYHRFLKQMDSQGRLRMVPEGEIERAVTQAMNGEDFRGKPAKIPAADPVVEFLKTWL